MEALTAFKNANRTMWATGDYHRMMQQEGLYAVGKRIVEHANVGPDDAVLDIACGTGNAAIAAAEAGANVTGIDLTPRMLDIAADRAAEAGVRIDFQEADAEALPFEDATFDVVLSTFGNMFAPRHEVVAEELVRVLRPGGRIGLCTWTAAGSIGDFFQTVSPYLPPPPNFADPPLLWGDPDHIRNLFEGTGVELAFRRETWTIGHDSTAAAVDCYTTTFAPVILARNLAAEQQRESALLDDMAAMIERHNTSENNHVSFPAEYLVILGRETG